MKTFQGENLGLKYGELEVLNGLSLTVPEGKISVILGPNGSGKSSLLRILARLIKPVTGTVLLDGKDIHTLPSKMVARKLSILSQILRSPEGLLVEELVWLGRHPYQKAFQKRSNEDYEAVERAIDLMEISPLRHRVLDHLSGGQKQRAWLAMVLAQQTSTLLLDEPTTYLDLRYQFEILNLLRKLNKNSQMTILMVLHDLNMASLYADHIFLLKEGRLIESGTPHEVLRPETLEDVFKIQIERIQTPAVVKPQFLFFC